MKTKITKIFLLTLTLALAIGMAVGFTASAEGETAESVAIVSQNVEYGGQTHLYFAVKCANVTNPEKIALNVSYVDSNGETKEVIITESEEVTLKDSEGNDVVCRAFRTPGVDAKSFTHKFVATAVTEAGTKSAEKTYSVTEYCLEWLTYIATQAEPTVEQLKIKDACEATLAYGTKIQALLDYYPAENDYPENYSYIVVDGGTANGKEKALVLNGTEVTLAANAGAPAVWSCTALDGTVTQLTENTFTANGSCIIAPINGKYFSDTSYTGIRLDYDAGAAVPSFNSGSADASLSNVDGNLEYKVTGAGGSDWIRAGSLSLAAFESPVLVLEADMMFKNITSNTFGWIKFANGGGTYGKETPQITMGTNKDGSIRIYVGADTTKGITVPANEWVNIRIEYDFNAETITFCVNNNYVASYAGTGAKSGSTRIRVSLVSSSNVGDTILMDNIFNGFVEDATPAPTAD